MKQIEITVCDKVARLVDENTIIICGNSDYVVNFDFDNEWDSYDVKTARFKWNGKYEERVFTGTQCDIPVINDTSCVYIGVYAGNLSTTTGARVPTRTSILCGSPVHNEPEPDVYNQIIALLEGIEGASEEEIAAAVAKYIAENPIEEKDPTVPEWAKTETKPTYTADEVGAIAESELQTDINTALAQAKASGEFDGADGKSAYAYAVEGGYSGTEAEFAVKLAAEKLANPFALTFTGAVIGSYDGSEAVTVNIPSGGSSSGGSGGLPNWRLIKTLAFSSEIASITFSEDDNGEAFAVKEFMIVGTVPGLASNGYLYCGIGTGATNALWPTAGKEMRWWLASVNGRLKTMLAVSSTTVVGSTDRNTSCPSDLVTICIGASNGFTADGTLYVYGR